MNSSAPFSLEPLASALLLGLRDELRLTPKPGLVDLRDSGSHPDLGYAVMSRSIDLLEEYFAALLTLLENGAPLAILIACGREAEERMLRRLGTNTHKGAIFLGGLLLAAAARCGRGRSPSLRGEIAALGAEIFALQNPQGTNGEAVRRDFKVGGILAEIRAGLPALFVVALPALRQSRQEGRGGDSAAFLAMSRLMQCVEDTTALHRCGLEGLERIRGDGARLESLLLAGADVVPFLERLNDDYRRLKLTMGGVADLLGVSLGSLRYLDVMDVAAKEASVQRRQDVIGEPAPC